MSDTFHSDIPDLSKFMKSLDMLDENVSKAAVTGLKKGADIIVNAQKRRISAKSQRLADAISKGTIYTTKKGSVGISTGYHAGAFKKDKDGFSTGLVGMVFEFGRPGQKGDTMKQKRNGETVTVKIGAVQPVPHIRAGFDEAGNSASQTVIDTVSAEIDKLGE